MTNETRERIKYYKEMLPNMKEKLVAAIMMLVVAACVTVTATYAWVTLSTAPEVASVDTTVTANGSLEIALASGEGSAPGKSAVGDSSATDGTDVTEANITWGNLVNLSDPSYGLSKITLRPAALNGTTGLLSNPLYGVGYGEDGRVSSMVTGDEFAYVYYDTKEEEFLADLTGTHLGVRAISTVQYTNLGAEGKITELTRYCEAKQIEATNNYAIMTNESSEPGASYIESIRCLVEVYAQSIIDERFVEGTKPVEELDVTKYVVNLYEMMKYFRDKVAYPTGESYVYLTDILDLLEGSTEGDSGYTVDTLVEASRSNTLPDYIKENIDCLSGLAGFATDYNQLSIYLKESQTGDYTDLTVEERSKSLAYWAYLAQKGGPVLWGDIDEHINWICDINSTTLDDKPLSSLSSVSNAAALVLGGSSKEHSAKLNAGAIYRMEKRIGAKMSPVIYVSVDASEVVSGFDNVTLKARLTTSVSADGPFELTTDRAAVKNLDGGSYKGTDAIAEDTYAMAIDLWVRTNAGSDGSQLGEPEIKNEVQTQIDGTTKNVIVETTTMAEQAYLTLEGAVITKDQEVQMTVEDANGDLQPVYTASYTTEDGTVNDARVIFQRYGTYYYIDENGNEIDFENEIKTTYGASTKITYTKTMITQKVVSGYEGVNRVWGEDQMAGFSSDTGTSTTQGGGSCYVFYADTPADQSSFLELLGSMRVAFISNELDGKMIGFATLDTENYYAESGKVTVPLVLDSSKAVDLGVDINGNQIYGLTALTKNAATRITALVYLDGTKLTNDMVLASGDIQGTLNIQFGSSVVLKKSIVTKDEDGTIEDTTIKYEQGQDSVAVENEKVMSQIIEVSAKVDRTSFEYDKDNPAETTLQVNIEGVEPGKVSARFMRAISSTQGVLQEEIVLSGSGSDWSSTVTFDKAGNYILRSVWVDGVEYSLAEPIEIEVIGNSVNSVQITNVALTDNRATIMTADNSFSAKILLGFTSSDSTPKSVNGIFMDENGRQVNVPFSQNEDKWEGTAKFTSSGTYTMEYVEIDGYIYELDEKLQPTLEILLGLKTRTWITTDSETLSNLRAVYPDATPTNFVLDSDAYKEGEAGITLQVSAEIYDNSGKELTGLSNVHLDYKREGSTVKGVYTDLTWDIVTGTYIGSFFVNEAGNYKFEKVTIGTANTITSYTSAPSIYAKPPGSIEYVDNYSRDVQFAKADTKITIGIKNSSAATFAEATLVNNKTKKTATVAGYIGEGDVSEVIDNSVTPWSFNIPTDWDDGTLAGEWQLLSLTMSGIYYNDVEYIYDENDLENSTFATIDLSSKNITTKVIEELTATLNVGDTIIGDDENSYFMQVPAVSGVSVSFSDDEGNNINDLIDDGKIAISNVKVTYYLNSTDIATEAFIKKYKYTGSVGDAISVSGNSTADAGRDKTATGVTQYNISDLGFEYAGPYDSCEVTYKITGSNLDKTVILKSETASSGLKYTVNGVKQDTVPTYEVYWKNLPTITITGTSPTGVTGTQQTTDDEFTTLVGSDRERVTVKNYYEDYYANVYLKWADWSYTAPSINIKLTNAGNKLNETNTATFTVPHSETAYTNSASFAGNNTSTSCEVGGASGWTRKIVGNVTIKTLSMKYGKSTLDVNLSNEIKIRQVAEAIPSITYVIEDEEIAKYYADITLGTYYGYDGRGSIKALDIPQSKDAQYVGGTVSSITSGEKTQIPNTDTTYVYYQKDVYGWTSYRYYNKFEKTYITWKDSGLADMYPRRLTFNGWLVDGVLYQAEDDIPLNGDVTAYAQITVEDGTTPIATETLVQRTCTATQYKWVETQKETIKITGTASVTPYVDSNGISHDVKTDSDLPEFTSGSREVNVEENVWSTVE